jgi:hypothetical protein
MTRELYPGSFRGFRAFDVRKIAKGEPPENTPWTKETAANDISLKLTEEYVLSSLSHFSCYFEPSIEHVAVCKMGGTYFDNEEAQKIQNECGCSYTVVKESTVISNVGVHTGTGRPMVHVNHTFGSCRKIDFYLKERLSNFSNSMEYIDFYRGIRQVFPLPMYDNSHEQDKVATFGTCRFGCGFYGFYDHRGYRWANGGYGITGHEPVVGVCDFYGRIAFATKGFRAEKMRIVALATQPVSPFWATRGHQGQISFVPNRKELEQERTNAILLNKGFEVFDNTQRLLEKYPLSDASTILEKNEKDF